MPIYDYRCDDCGHQFEVTQKFSDDILVFCPECQEQSLKIIIGNVFVHYKGPGFYTTEARGITGKKRKPNVKVGMTSDLPPEERERAKG